MNAMSQVVLVTGFVLLVTGCGGHHGMSRHGGGDGYADDRGANEIMALAEKTVQDPEKAKAVQAVLTEMMEEAKQSFKQTREYHRKLYELNANYDATPEEFTRILDDLNNGRMRTGSKILGLRFKMKELLTAQEWKALSDGLNAIRARYRHGGEAPEGTKSGS